MRDAKKLTVVVLALVAAAALVACGSSDSGTTDTSADDAAVTGSFAPVADAPAGYAETGGEAELTRPNGGTDLAISLTGLKPKTDYVAHLHTGGCDQAEPGGPHFQFEKGGSDEPPNEIHLEFSSDAAGEGEAKAASKREVPTGAAGSVVLHLGASHHEMSAYTPGEAETVFVHEGVDHSQEGEGHAQSDVIACADLEGPAAPEGDESASSGDVPTIVVRNGEPVGGIQTLEFSAGEEIRFRVSSDEAEEIHVHGYDLMKDVPAGGTIEFDFPAELEGIYEAELEGQATQIAELRINP